MTSTPLEPGHPFPRDTSRLRIAVVGSARFGLHEPFDGGLEAHTWDLARGLRARGHTVEIHAGPDSDPALGAIAMGSGTIRISAAARRDVGSSPPEMVAEHLAYLRTAQSLAARDDLDLVHLNTVHHLPVALTSLFRIPVTATLHCPPNSWLEPTWRELLPHERPVAVAVSDHLARCWSRIGEMPVLPVPNGVDLDTWRAGAGGGGHLVWSGRLVGEKGAHVAIDAARHAGLPILLAGPVHDEAYFRGQIAPRLGDQGGVSARWVGHLDRAALAELVGAARATVVTPLWDEPFGLVAAESLACGTPVAGTRRGALGEVVTPDVGVLADESPRAVGEAIRQAVRLPRDWCRQSAERRFSLARMVDSYEDLFLDCVHGDRWGQDAWPRPERMPAPAA